MRVSHLKKYICIYYSNCNAISAFIRALYAWYLSESIHSILKKKKKKICASESVIICHSSFVLYAIFSFLPLFLFLLLQQTELALTGIQATICDRRKTKEKAKEKNERQKVIEGPERAVVSRPVGDAWKGGHLYLFGYLAICQIVVHMVLGGRWSFFYGIIGSLFFIYLSFFLFVSLSPTLFPVFIAVQSFPLSPLFSLSHPLPLFLYI